ncbi:helix-turn-helix domain-containing protein [Nitrospira sp. M1]
MENPPILLTEEQVSKRYGIAVKTLANWRCKGDGPAFVKVGHHVRYSPENLQSFLSSHTFRSTKEYKETRKN